MKPVRQAPPCSKCSSACCREGSGWIYACWLQDEDLEKRTIKAKARWHKDKFWYLPYVNGKCPFLNGKTNQCKIYHLRPKVCREFNCRECSKHVGFLRQNAAVLELLKS